MNTRFTVVVGLDVGKTAHHACALDPAGNKLFDKPHTLRQVDRDNEVLSALKVLAGFDEDLAHETTRALNRIRSLLTQIHPALERVFAGGSLATGLVLDLLEKFGGPTGLKTAGRARVLRFARSHSRCDPEALIDQIFTALAEQTVIVPATAAVELVIPRVAGQVKELKEQRAVVAREVEAMLGDFPLASVLMSTPGIGIPPRSAREVPPDRRPDPPEHRRRLRFRDPRTSGGVCRDRAGHAKIRHLDPRRIPRQSGQQTTEERAVLFSLGRLEPRPDLQGLLRSQTR